MLVTNTLDVVGMSIPRELAFRAKYIFPKEVITLFEDKYSKSIFKVKEEDRDKDINIIFTESKDAE